MTVDVNSVKRLLDSDEPDYAAVVRLGAAALPALGRLIAGSDVRLAAAAASATGLMRHPGASQTLGRAARNASPVVRLAAAGAARNMQGPDINRLLHTLLADADHGVRKFAIKAAVARPGDTALLAKVRTIQASDPSPANRTLAGRALAFAANRGQGGGRVA
jgi:HEAT repeat protein